MFLLSSTQIDLLVHTVGYGEILAHGVPWNDRRDKLPQFENQDHKTISLAVAGICTHKRSKVVLPRSGVADAAARVTEANDYSLGQSRHRRKVVATGSDGMVIIVENASVHARESSVCDCSQDCDHLSPFATPLLTAPGWEQISK